MKSKTPNSPKKWLAEIVLAVVVLSLIASHGCQSEPDPKENEPAPKSEEPEKSPQYKILESGSPEDLHIQPIDAPYGLVVSTTEKGHEIVILPKAKEGVERFRSKRIRFWMDGHEVQVEVLEQGVVDVAEE